MSLIMPFTQEQLQYRNWLKVRESVSKQLSHLPSPSYLHPNSEFCARIQGARTTAVYRSLQHAASAGESAAQSVVLIDLLIDLLIIAVDRSGEMCSAAVHHVTATQLEAVGDR